MLQTPFALNLGKLVLRCSLGLMMLPHGISKLTNGVAGIAATLAAKGIPEFVAWGVIIGEVVASIFMILGYRTRIAAVVFAGNMLVATMLVHSNDLFSFGKSGAWKVELPMLYLFGAITVFLIGGGHYSLSRGRGRWD